MHIFNCILILFHASSVLANNHPVIRTGNIFVGQDMRKHKEFHLCMMLDQHPDMLMEVFNCRLTLITKIDNTDTKQLLDKHQYCHNRDKDNQSYHRSSHLFASFGEFAESPPAVIDSTPPKIKKNKTAITPTVKTIFSTVVINPPKPVFGAS